LKGKRGLRTKIFNLYLRVHRSSTWENGAFWEKSRREKRLAFLEGESERKFGGRVLWPTRVASSARKFVDGIKRHRNGGENERGVAQFV